VTVHSLHISNGVNLQGIGTNLKIVSGGSEHGIAVNYNANAVFRDGSLAVAGKTMATTVSQNSSASFFSSLTVQDCTWVSYTGSGGDSLYGIVGSVTADGISVAFGTEGGETRLGANINITAQTMYAVSAGGRIYQGAQTNVPNY
jgi:hypothetical protein